MIVKTMSNMIPNKLLLLRIAHTLFYKKRSRQSYKHILHKNRSTWNQNPNINNKEHKTSTFVFNFNIPIFVKMLERQLLNDTIKILVVPSNSQIRTENKEEDKNRRFYGNFTMIAFGLDLWKWASFVFCDLFLRMIKEAGSVIYKLEEYTSFLTNCISSINGPGDIEPNNNQHFAKGNATYCVCCN